MNGADAAISELIARLDVTAKYPGMIILDITNVCNFECPHCPQPAMAAQDGYRARFFDFDAFTRLVDEIKDKNVRFLRFTGDGEPMLHKRFLDMVAYAKAHSSTALVVTTNGSLLDRDRAERLLELGIDVIDVSLDAFSREKYEIVRKGGNFHEVMANLHWLISRRNKKYPKTKIMVNMIDQELVHDEVEAFKTYWTPVVDFVLVRTLHTATKQVNLVEVGKRMRTLQPERHACAHLWKRLTIDFSLNVKFCAHDWFDETILAKLGGDGLAPIWFGDRLKGLREAHLDNDYSRAKACADCPDWAAAPWQHGYELIIERLGVIAPL